MHHIECNHISSNAFFCCPWLFNVYLPLRINFPRDNLNHQRKKFTLENTKKVNNMTTKSSDNGYKEVYRPNLALLGHMNYKKNTVYLNVIRV